MGGPGFIRNIPFEELDNFYLCEFFFDGLKYTSSEACYQAQKFIEPEYKRLISKETNLHEMWKMGQDTKHITFSNWEDQKVEYMYKACYAKFSQNVLLKELLITFSGEKIIFTQGSLFWRENNAKILQRIALELDGIN